MAKLTLSDLTSLANDTSAVNTINANMALIEAAMDSAVFRTGVAPNTMGADFDLGSNYLLNIKSPNNSTDGANKAYVDSLLSGTTDAGSAQLRVDLASTATTEGASLVGVEDSGGNYTAADVEAALAEIASTGGAAIIGVEDSDSAFTATNLETVTKEIFDKTRYSEWSYLVASGTDTYTATPSPALTVYTTGETYRINFANASTSVSPTLNLNSLGAKTVRDLSGNILLIGEIDGDHLVTYDGTDMRLLNPAVVAVDFRGNLAGHNAQTIATATETTVQWDRATYDTDSIHSTTVNNTRLTVPSGVTKIRIHAGITWASNSTGYRKMRVTGNFSGEGFLQSNHNAINGDTTRMSGVSGVISTSAAIYYELKVTQNSGGNLNIEGSSYQNYFGMEILA